jgi:hypothetical protein
MFLALEVLNLDQSSRNWRRQEADYTASGNLEIEADVKEVETSK